MQNGLRVFLGAPDEPTADALDKLLWHYPAVAFIPHCRSHSAEAGEMPVIVGHQDNVFPHSEVLITLHDACPPFFSRFERVIEIVGLHDADKKLGRERYAFYRDRGYEMRHFDLATQAV